MKLVLVLAKTFAFLVYHFLQLSPDERISTDRVVIKNHHPVFRKGTGGKFTMPGMADLPDHQHFKGTPKNARDLRRHHHPATRQAHHHIRLDAPVVQMVSEPLSGILS